MVGTLSFLQSMGIESEISRYQELVSAHSFYVTIFRLLSLSILNYIDCQIIDSQTIQDPTVVGT